MATLTINTTAQQDQRIIAAFGTFLSTKDQDGNPRNATAAEVKDWLIGQLRGVVHSEETKTAVNAAAASVGQIDPT